jgi:hypothetical protein
MKEIIYLLLTAGFLFIISLSLFLFGFFRKKKILIFISAGICFIFLGIAVYTGWSIVSKSVHRVSEILKPRTGEEIYSQLYGKPQFGSLTILNFKDQIVPKVDTAIMLHFKTCPAELNRIVAGHDFTLEKKSTQGWDSGENDWFKPDLLGKTILVYKYQKDEFANEEIIYSNLEQTEVYCIDIQD